MKLAFIVAAAAAGLAAIATAQSPAAHAGAALAPSGPQPGVDGAELFASNCAACHQPMGEGIEGAFPKLAGSPFVSGDAKAVAATLLNGRGGMPAFRDDLTDGQLAAVASYVRASWGNHAPPITTAEFAALRSGDKAALERPIPAH
jgi:mono/diheme cytochrome c family protein